MHPWSRHAVVHVRARFSADGSDWMARYRLRGRIPCIDGTPGVETLPFAVEVDGEPVVVKQSFDGLFAAATATQLGYLVSVLSDCCSDTTEAHASTLAGYRFVFDTVRSSEIVDRRDEWDTQLQLMHPATGGVPSGG